MKVFVLGTGRCGTTTFAKACSHITNYTSGHETRAGSLDLGYPDNHIEVDPHLFWNLNTLVLDPNVAFVHLIREKETCVASLASRASTANLWIPFVYQKKNPDRSDILTAASRYYDFVNDAITGFLKGYMNRMVFRLGEPKGDWECFWNRIGAEGEYFAALQEFTIRHNAR